MRRKKLIDGKESQEKHNSAVFMGKKEQSIPLWSADWSAGRGRSEKCRYQNNQKGTKKEGK